MSKNKSQKPLLKNAMRLSGAGLQMGLTIYLFNFLGTWLNNYFQKEFLEITLTLFGVFASMYLLIRQVNKLNQ